MRGSDFIFDSVQLIYFKWNKVNFKWCSYNDSPRWLKNKKSAINPKNEDGKYAQYAATVALNFWKNWTITRKSFNIKPFVNKCNWEGINYPSKIKWLEKASEK